MPAASAVGPGVEAHAGDIGGGLARLERVHL